MMKKAVSRDKYARNYPGIMSNALRGDISKILLVSYHYNYPE